MKAQSVEGFIIARGFLAMYKEEGNKMNDHLSLILHLLNIKVQGYVRKKHNVNKMLERSWKDFLGIIKDEDASVQALPFCLRLIVANPVQDDKLTRLAKEESKRWLWSKDEDVVRAKDIVNKFYKIKRKK